MKLVKFIVIFAISLPKSVHQNPDLNIIIHLDESADGLPKIGRGVDGENIQFVGGKCKEGECMEDGKCIKITYRKHRGKLYECDGKCLLSKSPCNGKCKYGYCMLGQKCIEAQENGMYECDGKCIKFERPCNGQCTHQFYCKLGNKCKRKHWYVKEDKGEQFKSCNGDCLDKTDKCNGKCEDYECEMKDGSCMISDLPERIWKGCNGKCIKTSAKCNGLCDKVFFPLCERPGGTCADLVDRSNVKRILMLGICDGMCLELVSWNSTASCNGKCSPIMKFDATLGRNLSL